MEKSPFCISISMVNIIPQVQGSGHIPRYLSRQTFKYRKQTSSEGHNIFLWLAHHKQKAELTTMTSAHTIVFTKATQNLLVLSFRHALPCGAHNTDCS